MPLPHTLCQANPQHVEAMIPYLRALGTQYRISDGFHTDGPEAIVENLFRKIRLVENNIKLILLQRRRRRIVY